MVYDYLPIRIIWTAVPPSMKSGHEREFDPMEKVGMYFALVLCKLSNWLHNLIAQTLEIRVLGGKVCNCTGQSIVCPEGICLNIWKQVLSQNLAKIRSREIGFKNGDIILRINKPIDSTIMETPA